MATTADFRNGMVIRFRGELWKIIEFLHVKPGKGGAFVRTKLKNVRTGQVIDNTFRAGERVEEVRLEAKEMMYLYQDGDLRIFMDNVTYEQIPLPNELIAEAMQFVKENTVVKVLFEGERPVDIEIPPHVVLEVTRTEPGVRGDTAQGGSKPAELETGYVVQVPLFVNEGDKIKIDTRSGEYIERVKD